MGVRETRARTRLLLGEDQEMVRTGLRLVLEAEPDLTVVAEAATAEQALRLAAAARPDVVVVDAGLPGDTGLDAVEVTRRLAADGGPGRVVLLAGRADDDALFRGLSAGAAGFLVTTAPAGDLVRAVRAVAAGEAVLSPQPTRRLIERFTGGPAGAPALTFREVEVLRLLARGHSNAEIAARLVLGEATVKTHVARVLAKLGVRDRTRAVVFAYESGLVTARRR